MNSLDRGNTNNGLMTALFIVLLSFVIALAATLIAKQSASRTISTTAPQQMSDSK